MKCKNCYSELEEGVTLCPNCGTENAGPEKTGLSAGKIALLVVLAVAAIAVIAALILGGGAGTPAETTEPTGTVGDTTPTQTTPAPTIPADGNPDDVTCKGSYTVTDDQLAASLSTVVATVGDRQLTNEQLQVYYWMEVLEFLNEYYSYAAMFGLDVTQPLDTQLSLDGVNTWQQYFLDIALSNWHHYQAMCVEAESAGIVLSQDHLDYLKELPANLEQTALGANYESATAMIQADMGPGASVEGYLSYLSDYYLGYTYYGTSLESFEYTDADIEAYFDEHAEEYKENGLEKTDECYVDARHILITPTSATGASTYTEEEWAAAEARANEILNEWRSGAASEDTFAAMAGEYSMDPGSASNGGLYENMYEGQMVEPFENWCFDKTRQYGDYGIVKTNYGYHIMYFVRSIPVWFVAAQQDMMTEAGNNFLEEVLDKNPAEIDYSAIALGYVNLGAAG